MHGDTVTDDRSASWSEAPGPIVVVDFPWRGGGDVVYVNDMALDGDERLNLGKPVRLTDGALWYPGKVIKRDKARGMWYIRVNYGD
jgi:hypothetical protein